MKVILILTLALMGQDKPTQHAGEMKDLKTCQQEALKFLNHKFPSEVESRVVLKAAACALAKPGTPA